MKIPLLKTIPLLLGSFALTAQAVPIAGQINITGSSVTVVPPNVLGAVTAVNATTGTVSAVETNSSYPLSLMGDTVTYSGSRSTCSPSRCFSGPSPTWGARGSATRSTSPRLRRLSKLHSTCS